MDLRGRGHERVVRGPFGGTGTDGALHMGDMAEVGRFPWGDKSPLWGDTLAVLPYHYTRFIEGLPRRGGTVRCAPSPEWLDRIESADANDGVAGNSVGR